MRTTLRPFSKTNINLSTQNIKHSYAFSILKYNHNNPNIHFSTCGCWGILIDKQLRESERLAHLRAPDNNRVASR